MKEEQLDALLKEFVNIYNKMIDISLDAFLEPSLWFMPAETNTSKREAAHYFLLAAALNETEITGNARSARILLDDFHDVFGQRLYKITDPKELEIEVQKCESTFEFFDRMGPRKDEIPKIVASINFFVQDRCQGNLVEYAKQMVAKGKSPTDLFQELCEIPTVTGRHRGKFWIYLRWMTRKTPDLGLFNFNPKDLIVPLTNPTLQVLMARELVGKPPENFQATIKDNKEFWKESRTIENLQKSLNDYARLIFPHDPAMVDYPFFILGKWLTGFNLSQDCLTETLKFLIDKYHKIGTWPVRYLVERRHLNRYSCDFNIGAQSQLEIPVAEQLMQKGIKFEYEPLQFFWTKEHGIVSIPPPYTPDFLLSLTYKDKKVLLEPHGVWEDLKDYLGKLQVFRKNFGQYFYLILVVPENFAESILKMDPNSQACDQMWTIKEFSRKIQELQLLCRVF